jgi:hypothetical protein
MGRRRAPQRYAGPEAPPDLYYGINRGRFILSSDQARTEESLREHRRWTAGVLAAGWTVSALREAAAHDQGYTNWLRAQRRERLMQQDNDHRRQA